MRQTKVNVIFFVFFICQLTWNTYFFYETETDRHKSNANHSVATLIYLYVIVATMLLYRISKIIVATFSIPHPPHKTHFSLVRVCVPFLDASFASFTSEVYAQKRGWDDIDIVTHTLCCVWEGVVGRKKGGLIGAFTICMYNIYY